MFGSKGLIQFGVLFLPVLSSHGVILATLPEQHVISKRLAELRVNCEHTLPLQFRATIFSKNWHQSAPQWTLFSLLHGGSTYHM